MPLFDIKTFDTQQLRSRMLCEAYEVGWDFVIAPEQQQQRSQPHQNHVASHTGEDPSCSLPKNVFKILIKFLNP